MEKIKPKMGKLGIEFYINHDVVSVAKQLIGKILRTINFPEFITNTLLGV